MRQDTMIDGVAEEVDMLDRHLEVIQMVVDNEPIGIMKMSNELGYDHHEIRYSLRLLEEEDLIEPTQQGAITTDETDRSSRALMENRRHENKTHRNED